MDLPNHQQVVILPTMIEVSCEIPAWQQALTGDNVDRVLIDHPRDVKQCGRGDDEKGRDDDGMWRRRKRFRLDGIARHRAQSACAQSTHTTMRSLCSAMSSAFRQTEFP